MEFIKTHALVSTVRVNIVTEGWLWLEDADCTTYVEPFHGTPEALKYRCATLAEEMASAGFEDVKSYYTFEQENPRFARDKWVEI
jgi:hypothetical protein